MATNMAPHNLTEVYEAIKPVATKRRPKPTIDETFMAGPGPGICCRAVSSSTTAAPTPTPPAPLRSGMRANAGIVNPTAPACGHRRHATAVHGRF
ncbi:MAG: hypothetical protein IPG46_08310 [Actinobacteria bacterium]|nr:hypothetical protein [Actinomycetota bacterium]